MPASPDRPRAVALRALKLGDLLVAVPALHALRRALPEHRISLAATGWLAPIVPLLDAVDDFVPLTGLVPFTLDTPPDVAVNLHGAGPPSTTILDALTPRRRIGHAGGGWPGPDWHDDLPERHRWCRMVRAHGIPADPEEVWLAEPAVPSPRPGATLVHPGGRYGAKRWPPERFSAVARALADRGHEVVVTGGQGERALGADVVARAGLPPTALLADHTDLPELAALVAEAALIVCGDTGIAHLSYAYATPSVVLFGPAPAAVWGPPREGPHRALSHDDLRRGDTFGADPDPALLAVTVDEVLAAVDQVLAASRRARA
ncbi:glycosyltransferase family 9 protein [Nocardia farcinica]|uniref:glycosyltransferase family 9 protein n=1 Tax=Nocardia farcinica TaxID=37329 RepID=UPI0018935638|nr:glycosyltransferase family 9 protein [Nocardia farcinica]MBF6443294.1 glycosyltransferase family 9 protein [Nocardia farcinica]